MTVTNSEDVAAVIVLAETGGSWRIIAKAFDVPPQT